jgi:hypothetical protein
MFVVTEYMKDTFTSVFYNDTSPDEHPNHNSGNVLDESLMTDILQAAPAEVRANPAAYPEWFKEDLYNRLYDQTRNSGDPALLAQLSLDAMLRAPKTVSEKLLPYEEQSIEMWTETVMRFIDNSGDHVAAAGRLQAILNKGTVTVREITGGYTSSGYMKRDGIVLDQEHRDLLGRNAVPLPVLEDSRGLKGWEIVFTFPNEEILSFRIDCGYQPDSTSYPSGGKTPTYRPPDITIDIGDPDPTPTPTPTPKPTPKPKPTPAPKDPDKGPQGQNPGNPDYGGGSNTNNDTSLKPEPSSPPTYTSPSKPTPPPANDDRWDTPADNGNGLLDNQPGSGTAGEDIYGSVPDKPLDEVHEDPPSVEPGYGGGSNRTDPVPPK